MDEKASLAEQAECRVIHMTYDVTMTPPQTGSLGETEAAVEIGRGLISEVFTLLKVVAEAEGFVVDVTARQVVY